MTVAYLLDTDCIIHWLNGNPEIGRRLDEARPRGLALSVVSLAELYEGVYYSKTPEENERRLDDFLAGMTLHPLARGQPRGSCRIRRGCCRPFPAAQTSGSCREDPAGLEKKALLFPSEIG